jgi:hypothetical protein
MGKYEMFLLKVLKRVKTVFEKLSKYKLEEETAKHI